MTAPNQLLQGGSSNLASAFTRVQVIANLFLTNDEDQLYRLLQLNGVTWPIDVYHPPGSADGVLSYCCLTSQNAAYIFIGGIENTTMGTLVWDGYTGPINPFTTIRNGIHQNIGNWANTIFNRTLNVCQNRQHIYVCGHSAGGYAANLVGGLYSKFFNNPHRVSVTTFGTPKLGINENIPQAMERWHWFNSDDAVCTVPPVINGTSLWAVALTPFQGVAITFYNQFNAGTQINPDSTLVNGVASTGLPAPDWISAAAWLVQNTLSIANPHNVQQYVQRLFVAKTRQPQFNPAPFDTGNRVRSQELGVQEARQIHNEIVQTVFTTNRPPAVVNPILPSGEVFSVQRVGKAYMVQFGDISIALGPHKRTAHGLSRLGNAFLRRLQTEGLVDKNAFVYQLEQYLDEASTNPAFNPLLQVTQE